MQDFWNTCMRCASLLVWMLSGVVLCGCATVNDVMTPSLTQRTDAITSEQLIEQPLVPANTSMSEHANQLGFLWRSGYPNTIFLTVSTARRTDIDDVIFLIDGQRLDGLTPFEQHTRYTPYGYLSIPRSSRVFLISLVDFQRLATAKDVRMRVYTWDGASTSSFGHGSACIVSQKFAPFLEAIDTQYTP